jgi:dCTP deaminase
MPISSECFSIIVGVYKIWYHYILFATNFMIKNDIWIYEQCKKGMIAPYVKRSVRQVENLKVISYGLSSYGYDIRLSSKEFKTFRHIPGTVVDPKSFNPDNLEAGVLHTDESGSYFIIPAHTYALGVAVERLEIPDNITVICIGKSSYARCGVILNLTPAEAGWKGHLTLELSNSSSADVKVYTDEGICQLLFFEGEPCAVTYNDRLGKYQNQTENITIAKL